MSIIVKGMDMPKGCFFCSLVGGDYRCRISHLDVSQHTFRRHSACPLIEIPTEHGRLIDADRMDLQSELFTFTRYTGIDEAPLEDATSILYQAPTVVPAEKGGAE